MSVEPSSSSSERLPTHVAVIMDGNGRWARQRGLSRIEGHRAGAENVSPIVHSFAEAGVKYLSLYAFSTENWLRPFEEVQSLMVLLAEVIEREAERLHREGIRLLHLGRLDRVDPSLRESIQRIVEETRRNTGLTICIAFDYGGREEIVEAVRRILHAGIRPEEVTEELLAQFLFTAGVPDPDLIVRTAGEMRISNFLLWQGAYAEYYSAPVLWPDFGPEEVSQALKAYGRRQRRFGALDANA